MLPCQGRCREFESRLPLIFTPENTSKLPNIKLLGKLKSSASERSVQGVGAKSLRELSLFSDLNAVYSILKEWAKADA